MRIKSKKQASKHGSVEAFKKEQQQRRAERDQRLQRRKAA